MEAVPPFPRRDPSPLISSVVNVPAFGRCSVRDVWDAWFLAQEESECAYREWASAPRRLRGQRFARYRAALEREDRAAVVLGATVGELDRAA